MDSVDPNERSKQDRPRDPYGGGFADKDADSLRGKDEDISRDDDDLYSSVLSPHPSETDSTSPSYPTPTYEQPRRPQFGSYILAGWGKRFAAILLDALILIAPIALISLPILMSDEKFTLGRQAVITLGGLLVGMFYYGMLMAREGSNNGQTFGKQAVSIRVVRDSGEPVTFWFAVLRETFVKQILFGELAVFSLYIATFLNYLWPLWDEKNEALHDKIVKTHVVQT